MNTLRNDRPRGLSTNAMRCWGCLLLLLGVAGQGVIQNGILHIGNVTTAQLLEAMNADENLMIWATIALVLSAVSSCAAPIFAFLTVEGAQHTSNMGNYLKRVVLLALVSEIPYNLAMSGKVLEFSTRNPVFSVVLCLVMLVLYGQFQAPGLKNTAIKAAVTLAAVVWAGMLGISDGVPMVVLCATFWGFRKKPNFRNLAVLGAACLCSMFTTQYLAAPMGVLLLHLHNGEQGGQNRIVNYAAYPVMLVFAAVIQMFL